MSLFSEFKRRNVFRIGAAYVIGAWAMLQVIDVVLPILELPNWIAKTVLIILLAGFPVALLLAWAFEMTPEGIKRDEDVDRSQSSIGTAGRKLDFVIIGVLSIAVISFALDKFLGEEPATRIAGGIAYKRSIAVLPFVSISQETGNDYFADGLAEEILHLLSKIPDLKVIGRASSFSFKGKHLDLREIGKILDVQTVLEGSVRTAGERVRISAQLSDTSDASNMWSDSYDRTMSDIFAVQDDVASSIIEALQIHVGTMPSRGRPTDNTDAYSLFLKARVKVNAFEFRAAEQALQNAIQLDPNFAEAYELLAYCYWFLGGTVLNSKDGQKRVGDAAAKALVIDPDLIFAQALDKAANTDPYSFQVEIEALERAMALQPNNPWTFGILVFRLMETGYLTEAVTMAERFVGFDPLSSVAHNRLAEALYAVGRISEAEAALDIAEELGSDAAHWLLGHMNLAEKKDEVAIGHFESFLQQYDYPDELWVRELVTGSRHPVSGEAYLDLRIPQIVASLPEEYAFEIEGTLITWYLFFGFLDRQFDRIFELDLTDSSWTDADVPIWQGTLFRRLGFTAHPKYLELAEEIGLVKLWEERGPPDFCNKIDGEWVCE